MIDFIAGRLHARPSASVNVGVLQGYHAPVDPVADQLHCPLPTVTKLHLQAMDAHDRGLAAYIVMDIELYDRHRGLGRRVPIRNGQSAPLNRPGPSRADLYGVVMSR